MPIWKLNKNNGSQSLHHGINIKYQYSYTQDVFMKYKFDISLTISSDDNRDDKSIDTEDTSHNYWNDRLEDEFWSQDGDTTDSDS